MLEKFSSSKSTPFLRRSLVVAAVLAVAAVSGCASLAGGGQESPEQVVSQRATERWQMLVSGNLEKAYMFTSPSYRAITKFETYSKGMGSVATWVGAEVLRVECETAEKCTARVKIEAKPLLEHRFKGTITSGVDETWLLENGQWWLFQKL